MRQKTRFASVASVAVLAATLAACSSQPLYPTAQPATYPSAPAPVYQSTYPSGGTAPNYAQYGRVTGVQLIQGQQAGTTGAGAIIGGIGGAVIGNQIGGGRGRDVARIAGVVGGALAGNAIEQNSKSRGNDVYRVSVQTDNGALQVFDLAGSTDLRAGDRVRIENGQLFRY